MSAHDDQNDAPMLPPGGVTDEVGEETMESVDAGLLGSSGIASSGFDTRLSQTTPVEAELVDESNLNDTQASALDPASEDTVNFGSETMAAMKAASMRKLGDFELERKIGQGGMGEVWLARQVSLDRPVAVKVLPRSLATQENFIERFEREAKSAASLVHPSVIQIYAYGIDEGTPYFAMEYVEGEDLQQRIRRERFLDWDEIVAILMSVTSALEVAHEKGLIHRDIKPSNIMIDKKGIVKVMDFGLAKAIIGGPETGDLTNPGLIMGTPNYLAPEQGRGDPLDGRSDLYSLGIVFYELLTGQLPFKADSPAGLIFKHVYEPPPPPLEIRPEIPPFLVEITLKLLEKDPDDRYRNAQEFHDDLKSFFDNYDHYLEGGAALPPSRETSRSGSGVIPAIGGRRGPSPSSRRNAITEPVTKPIELADFEDEPPPLDDETILEVPPSKRPSSSASHQVQTKISPARAAAKKTPPPPKKSRASVFVLLLLLLCAAGGAYAWEYHNKETREYMTRLGLLKPIEPGASPIGSAVATTSPRPSGSPLAPLASLPSLQANEVGYSFDGAWPEGIEIRLARAKHDPIVLQRGSTGRYALGTDYRISFSRSGYEPVSFPVSLARRTDEQNRGHLLDAEGDPVSADQLTWNATSELSGAYVRGQLALDADRLEQAEKELELAARLDSGYRPQSTEPNRVSPTVSDLLRRLADRRRESAAADQRLATLVASAKGQAKDLQLRSAIDMLKKWPNQSELPAEAKANISGWEAKIQQGEEILNGAKAAIKRGDHVATEAALARMQTVDRSNPKTVGVQERLKSAKASRALALSGKGDLSAQLALVISYVSNFGEEDAELLQRRKALEGKVGEAKKFEVNYQALRQDATAKRWDSVRKKAALLLKKYPQHQDLQELYSQALKAIAGQQIAALLSRLDGALKSGKADEAIRLLDPKSKQYAIEKRALQRMRRAKAVFLESGHEIQSVSIQGGYAKVRTRWRFRLHILDQPPKSFLAVHVLQLRQVARGARGEASWLISELKVEGGVRAQ
ncbi:MAG: serine/threonine protein kinase [Planctomycetes bacterium]|nr:serine/threonine protein kinase [Planctomycetota bacterium]